jgi:hypothetical protein
MSVRGVSIPYWARIILVIFLDIWLLWSHHGILYTPRGKFVIPNPFNFGICTFGAQWPSASCVKHSHKLEAVFEPGKAFTHYIPFIKDNFKDVVLCTSVCGFGRLGVWSSILVSNVIYLTTDKFRKDKKQLKIIQIFGWILIGMNMGLSLIMNWPLFIRSIPAYVILIMLQLDLYSYDSDAPENIPSTTTPLPTTTK